MSDELKLKPCPFCGSEAVHTESSYFRDTLIYCENCDAYFTVDSFYADENDVIEAWNRRAEPERKKGEWNFVGDNMFECTHCRVVYTTQQLNGLRNYDVDPYAPRFCPNCGSRMTRGE